MRSRGFLAVSLFLLVCGCKKHPAAADQTVVDAAMAAPSETASAAPAPSASVGEAASASPAPGGAASAAGAASPPPFAGNYLCIFNGVANDMHLSQTGANITGVVKPAPPQKSDLEHDLSCTAAGNTATCADTAMNTKPTRHAIGHANVSMTVSGGSIAYVMGSMHATCKHK